jgi:hypothetical protein
MDNLQLSQGGSMAFASGALANGTNAGSIKTTATVPFTVDGIFYSKAATDNLPFTMTVPAVSSNGYATNGSFTGQTGGSTRLYGVYLDSAGAVTHVPGPICNSTELAAGSCALQFPPPQRGKACIGMVRIAVTAGTTFIPGTTALNAAGVTTTYLNLSGIPGEPVRS